MTNIPGKRVEVVEECRYGGTLFDGLLKLSFNTEEIIRKCHHRQCLLWKLSSFGFNNDILLTLHHLFIKSILTFSFIPWLHYITLQDRTHLLSFPKVCYRSVCLFPPKNLPLCSQNPAQPHHMHYLHCSCCRRQWRRVTFFHKGV